MVSEALGSRLQDSTDMILKFNMLMRMVARCWVVPLPEGQTRSLLSCPGIFKFVSGIRLLE